MVLSMDLEFKFGQMDTVTKVNSKMTKGMERVYLLLMIATSMMENL